MRRPLFLVAGALVWTVFLLTLLAVFLAASGCASSRRPAPAPTARLDPARPLLDPRARRVTVQGMEVEFIPAAAFELAPIHPLPPLERAQEKARPPILPPDGFN
jgi:hypothetical protein